MPLSLFRLRRKPSSQTRGLYPLVGEIPDRPRLGGSNLARYKRIQIPNVTKRKCRGLCSAFVANFVENLVGNFSNFLAVTYPEGIPATSLTDRPRLGGSNLALRAHRNPKRDTAQMPL